MKNDLSIYYLFLLKILGLVKWLENQESTNGKVYSTKKFRNSSVYG